MPPGHQEIVGKLSVMNTIKVTICASLLILAILACNLPSTALPTSVNVEQALTIAVQTITAQAQALPVLPTTAAPIVLPVATISPALDPSPTIAPIDSPTITFTASPTVPIVNVTTATNCRTGPGKLYEIIAGADVGIYYEVVGKYIPDNYWIIKLPDGRQCWLWGQYAMLQGNISVLPEYAPPVGSIQGVVIDLRSGNGIENAMVQIESRGFFTDTDKNGNFFFANLPVGEVIITVQSSSYTFPTLSVTVHAGQTSQARIAGSRFIPAPTPTRCPLGHSCVPIPDQPTAP